MSTAPQDYAHELDARGLNCPLPILKIKKVINRAEAGDVVRMISTDLGSLKDMEAFCKQTGNMLLSSQSDGGEHTFYVRKT